MTTIELKSKLVKEINEIDDMGLLSSLEIFLDFNKNAEEHYVLNEVQKMLLEQSEKEIGRGNVKTHEEVMKNIKEWMKRNNLDVDC